MRPTTCRRIALAAATFALAAGVALAGGPMPKLPPDRALPQTGDSPGVVTFSHATHLQAGRADCTTCHPKTFRILAAPDPKDSGLRHEGMEAGQQCGACHGKAAFAFDDCAACHK